MISPFMTVDQALREAVIRHKSCQLQEAERLYRAVLQEQPNQPDANHNLGVLAVQSQRPAASLAYFKTALEANPNNGQYWISYVDALIRAGEKEAARQVLIQGRQRGLEGEAVEALAGRLEAQKSGPDSRSPLPAIAAQRVSADRVGMSPYAPALEYREAGRYEEAIEWLQSRLISEPRDAKAHAHLAHVLSLNGQDETAWVAMNTAIAIHSSLPVVQRNLARLLLKQRKSEEASRAAYCAWQAEPNEAENQLVLAATLGAKGENGKAMGLVESALQSRPGYAEAYAGRSLLRMRTGDLVRALQDAETALAIKPHLSHLWGMVGSLRYQLKDLPGAIEAMERALVQEPDNVMHMMNLGEFKRRAGAMDAAIALLEKALAKVPDNAEGWVNLGTALQQSGRMEEARIAYGKSLAIKPDQAEVESNLGALALDAENSDEAVHYLRRALEMNPNCGEAYNNLGNALKKKGALSEAEISYRRALEIKPDFAAAHYNLGNALSELGQLDEAVVAYEKAIHYRPDMAEAYTNLGDALGFMGKSDWEMRAYRQALVLDPSGVGMCAAVWLAIWYYLEDNTEQFRNMLQASERIMTRTDGKYETVRTYWLYLARLLSLSQQPNRQELCRREVPPLYVIGESHCLSAHGAIVRYKETEMRCIAQWILGCKQWHLGNDKANKYKRKFELIMKDVPRRSTVLLTIGEIDCRPGEGIIKAWKKFPDKSIGEIAQVTAEGYVRYVTEVASRYDHRLIVGGVPATNMDLDTLTADESAQFVCLIRDFNATLKSFALNAGMDFLDVYAMTDRGDGIAGGQWHIDKTHLLPCAMVEAFDRHCIQGSLFLTPDF